MKKTTGKPITPQQLKALQVCFKQMGFDTEERHACVNFFTNTRTSSSKELTFDEASRMLSFLNKDSDAKVSAVAKKVVGEIYGLSMRISFLNKDFPADTEEEFEMNKAKLNVFARTRSACRKNITTMNLIELKEFKKQLEAILHKEEKQPKK